MWIANGPVDSNARVDFLGNPIHVNQEVISNEEIKYNVTCCIASNYNSSLSTLIGMSSDKENCQHWYTLDSIMLIKKATSRGK